MTDPKDDAEPSAERSPHPGTWDEAFAERYDEWSADMTDHIAFYVSLAQEAQGPIAELAVGGGRVAIPVARAARRSVLGVDTSPRMLAVAEERAARAGVELQLRRQDMRDFTVDEPAALVYCPYRALLHLPTWADRRRTFERVAAALAPGGRFAWDTFVFDHQAAVRYDGQVRRDPTPHRVAYSVVEGRFDLILESGARSSLWWATKNEWLGLIEVSGLELEALYGGFKREQLSEQSREYVFVARRPSGSGETR